MSLISMEKWSTSAEKHGWNLSHEKINKLVRTPLGVGVLKGVAYSRAAVVLEGYRRCTHYRVDEVAVETEEAKGVDPRPELGDTELWVSILNEADREVRIVLRGFRGMGCILAREPQGLAIRPVIGNHWFSEDAFKEARRKWAKPYLQEIAALLGR